MKAFTAIDAFTVALPRHLQYREDDRQGVGKRNRIADRDRLYVLSILRFGLVTSLNFAAREPRWS
ncbi:hypothetical protein [Streptomyces sp. NPDC056491]|uniref:hypothetical protein n=1 Tax=Streptomyces sp. NPDC056491 TaxID=3345837 RepID=UPI0036A479B1